MIKLRAHARAKSCAMCLLLIMIAAVFIISPTFSSLTQNVVIPCTGIIGGLKVNATSGLPADIQAAVNAVNSAGGGIVYVPAGTFHWNGQTVTIPGGVNIIGASLAGCMGHENNWQEYTATTILHNDAAPTSSHDMFYVDGRNGKSFRISGIQFEATPPTDTAMENLEAANAIYILQGKNFRIDHCTFINFDGTSVLSTSSSWYGATGNRSAYGLVDHCVFNLPYKDTGGPWQWGYGVYPIGNMKTGINYVDEIAPYAGKFEAKTDVSIVYVEDCKFSRMRHAVDSYCGGAMCARYNLFMEPPRYQGTSTDIGQIDQHGGFGGGGDGAGVLLEAYNNTIMGKVNFATWAYRIRGGHGLCYNNIFNPPDNSGNIFVTLDGDGGSPVTKTYIWDNQYSNCTFLKNNAGRTLNVDYFLRAPTQALDGWTYTPYPYPHPLVAG